MKRIGVLIAIAGAAALGGCALFSASDSQSPLEDAPLETSVIATVSALATRALPDPLSPTATPMHLADDEPESSPTPVPTDLWGDFATPSGPSSTDIPPPMPEIAFEPGVFNVLLMGTDERPGAFGFRTDTLMVVSIDPAADTATMISFPRDLYVYIPGWRMNRINTAMVHGGFDMTRETILYNFGIPVEAWARMEFSGFTDAVNTLGGIDVQSTKYLQDECRGDILKYSSGVTYHMDGDEALCYVRMRKVGGDFDRMRRQQEVIRAIFDKVLSIDGLARVPQLYNQFFNMLITDIEVGELVPLVPTAAQIALDPDRIRQFSVDRDLVQFWRTPGGGSVLLPNRPAVQLLLMEAFGPEAFASLQ